MTTSIRPPSKTEAQLREILAKRIMFLDGAMGTIIQQYKLDEKAYRGERFVDFAAPAGSGHRELFVKGNNELLTLTQPDEGLVALPLTTPDITYVIGLVYAERDPALPMAKALAASATENKLSTRIAEYTRDRLRQSGVIGF